MTKNLFITLTSIFVFSFTYASDDLPQEIETLHGSKESYKDIRLSVGGGYARRLGEKEQTTDYKVNQLTDKIQNEVYLEFDGQYFFKETWGLGLVVNNASASGEVSGASIKTNILYVGPTYSMRFDFDKFLLVWNIGLGPLFYSEKFDFNSLNYDLNHTTVGMQTNFSGEYKVSQKVGIGLKLGWISGTANFKKSEYFTEDYKMNLSNLNIGAFLSFRSW